MSINLQADLDVLRSSNLYRIPFTVAAQKRSTIWVDRRRHINFSSNNYLGLATHPKVIAAACRAAKEWGTSSGASRLLSGNLKIHEDLEKALARFKKEETVTIFSSGYLANLGAVCSLVGPGDLVIVDRLNHASLIDATKLSGAKLWVYPHCDGRALEKLLSRAKDFRRKLVVTDAYFSMDGDLTPLPELLEVCRRADAWLFVDEAHSTGVFGKAGRGATEHYGLEGQIPIVMGTLSKALGSVGGFVAGSSLLKETITNRARGFVYTTGPSPMASAAALASVLLAQTEPFRLKKLWLNIRFLRTALEGLGFDLGASVGPIIPLLIRDTRKTLTVARFLREKGIYAPAIRPPSVPKNTDRIRISLSADHDQKQLHALIKAMDLARKKFL